MRALVCARVRACVLWEVVAAKWILYMDKSVGIHFHLVHHLQYTSVYLSPTVILCHHLSCHHLSSLVKLSPVMHSAICLVAPNR